MKPLLLLSLAALAGLSSCEKIKSLTASLGKKPAAAAAKPYSGALVSEIPDGAFDTFPLQPGRVVIVDFYADWCGPCRQLAPVLDKIAEENQGLVLVGRVNVDKFKDLAGKEGVNGIPDVRIYRDGSKVDHFVGMPGEAEVRKRIASQTKGLAPLPPEAAAKTKTAEPLMRPMDKDWLPKGMQRR